MLDGHFFALKKGVSGYVGRFYRDIYTDTPAVAEFKQRGLAGSFMWAADRMVDAAEDMLKSYTKNSNSPSGAVTPNANSVFPVVLMAMSRDYIPTGGDWGGRQVPRQMVKLIDGPDASAYGYKQAMGDVRWQVLVVAADSNSARSIAAQFCLFVGDPANRRFTMPFSWGQYTLDMPVMIESPDLLFSNADLGRPNVTALVADVTLKATFPYLDAPAGTDPNDGSANNPRGYPLVEQIELFHFPVRKHTTVNATGITHDGNMGDKVPPEQETGN